MSSFICHPPRRPLPLPAGPAEEMEEVFSMDLTVATTINQLDKYNWNASDLQWAIANKKGKVKAWAKKELAALNKDAAVLDDGAEFDA